MTWERARAGLVSGIASLAPLLLVMLLTGVGLVAGDAALTLALLAFPASILLGGGLAGYLVGQGKRRRSEAKAAVGGAAGVIAGIIFALLLESFYLIRSPGTALAVHPLRVIFAIILMATLMVAVAMMTTQLTAKPLPPPRRTRRLTSQMPAVAPPSQSDERTRTPAR
jgi:hypothetical protein